MVAEGGIWVPEQLEAAYKSGAYTAVSYTHLDVYKRQVHDGRFLYITLYGVCCLCCGIALNLLYQNRRFVLIYKSCRK